MTFATTTPTPTGGDSKRARKPPKGPLHPQRAFFWRSRFSVCGFFSNQGNHMADKLIIFDTTLRDGEQSPGASMTRDEKLRIARQLERLKVDVIEAGFAASSNGDFEAVQPLPTISDSTVCSLSRANDRDIARAAEALKGRTRRASTPSSPRRPCTWRKAAHDARPGVGAGQAVGAFCAQPGGRHRVQPEDGYRSEGFPVPRARGGDPRAPPPSTCPTPWATPFPSCTATSSRTCASASQQRQGHLVRALPQRPGHGVANPLAGGRRSVAARARWSAPSTAWASARATVRWKKW